MPVYNESPERVVAGVRATLESLCEQKTDGRYDLYILSDTTDPEIWLAEELAWSRLNREFAGRVDVYYRHRPRNLARKSGNIADFCERSEEHTSELQSLMRISYAVFRLKKT